MSEFSMIAEGRFLRLLDLGGWEFVQRTRSSGVVCIVATTQQNKLLLVEQFRPPLNARVIELPAGLVGDVLDADESFESAARRELMEETGYETDEWKQLCDIVSSGGLTDEVVTVFRASQSRRTAPGGGDENESIIVHEVEIESIIDWLEGAVRDGKRIDSRVYGSATFLQM